MLVGQGGRIEKGDNLGMFYRIWMVDDREPRRRATRHQEWTNNSLKGESSVGYGALLI